MFIIFNILIRDKDFICNEFKHLSFSLLKNIWTCFKYISGSTYIRIIYNTINTSSTLTVQAKHSEYSSTSKFFNSTDIIASNVVYVYSKLEQFNLPE